MPGQLEEGLSSSVSLGPASSNPLSIPPSEKTLCHLPLSHHRRAFMAFVLGQHPAPCLASSCATTRCEACLVPGRHLGSASPWGLAAGRGCWVNLTSALGGPQSHRTPLACRYQQILHRNLVYLATIADSNQNVQSLLPAVSAWGGRASHSRPGQPGTASECQGAAEV